MRKKYETFHEFIASYKILLLNVDPASENECLTPSKEHYENGVTLRT